MKDLLLWKSAIDTKMPPLKKKPNNINNEFLLKKSLDILVIHHFTAPDVSTVEVLHWFHCSLMCCVAFGADNVWFSVCWCHRQLTLWLLVPLQVIMHWQICTLCVFLLTLSLVLHWSAFYTEGSVSMMFSFSRTCRSSRMECML